MAVIAVVVGLVGALSAVLLGVSVWIRLQLSESPLFQQMKAEGRQSKAPIRESFFSRNGRIVLLALLNSGWFARHAEDAPIIYRPPVDPPVLARMTEGLRRAGFSRVVVDPRGYDRPDPLPQFPEEVPDGNRG